MPERLSNEIQLAGKRVLVMGLGSHQGGLGVTRYLVSQGADVTVTDLRTADDLRPTLDALSDLPVQYRLGEHRSEDFEAAEIVVRNPGVPFDSPWLVQARASGARIEMEMSLFFRACPAPIIGVTGTKGKTTTSTLCHQILMHHRPDSVLAGNMGRSALEALPVINPDTPVVIELSSWQLEGLAEHGLSPHIAVWTNVSEDHLNRYPSYSHYVDAKRHIARFQSDADWFILNRDDPVVWDSRGVGQARTLPFGRLNADSAPTGAFYDGDQLIWRWDGEDAVILRRTDLPLQGHHAVMNALAASAAALLTGASLDVVRSGLRQAGAVPHRQEPVGVIDGVLFINDTTATAPAAVLAALETYSDRPIVLISGGAEKAVRLDGLAREVAAKAQSVVLLDGDATPDLHQLLVDAGARQISGPHGSMDDAVRAAADLAQPGAVVLLSPGCASFGMFRNEFQRGEAFRAAVRALAEANAEGVHSWP